MINNSFIKFSYLIFLVLIASCASPASHLIVGQVRQPISPEIVKIYTKPPSAYDEIAILSSSDMGQLAFTDQQKLDNSIEGLKSAAAKLGANGVLLTSIEDKYITQGTVVGALKITKGIAIYVPSK
jgi:hypothetical protein